MQSLFKFITIVSAALVVGVSAAPASDVTTLVARSDGEAHLVATWYEFPGTRYRFRFTGSTAEDASCGIAFLNQLRQNGGITNNWQCWYDGDLGSYVFDDTEAEGIAGQGIMQRSVSGVTGQSCSDIGLCG